MTTASRPTWCPAKGTELDNNSAPSLYYSAKDQLGHKKLKLRDSVKPTHDESVSAQIDLASSKNEDLCKLEYPSYGEEDKVLILENESIVYGKENHEGDDSEFDEEEEEEEEKEEEEDAELLLLELEKIKRERLEEKKKLSQAEDQAIMSGNPIRFKQNALISWTDDTVFKNQVSAESKPKKRFINDMIRSDFHRKFMDKYIK